MSSSIYNTDLDGSHGDRVLCGEAPRPWGPLANADDGYEHVPDDDPDL